VHDGTFVTNECLLMQVDLDLPPEVLQPTAPKAIPLTCFWDGKTLRTSKFEMESVNEWEIVHFITLFTFSYLCFLL